MYNAVTEPISDRQITKPVPTFIDKILAETFLPFIPHWIEPNHVTFIRFCFVPSVIYLLFTQQYELGLLFFSFAAFTDALDGAMARTRDRVTDWGKLYDPLADKLLVGSTAIIMLGRFLDVWIVVTIVAIEFLLIVQAGYQRYILHQEVQAKLVGKVKMLLQCLGVILVFVFAIFGGAGYIFAAKLMLYAAIFLAAVSLVVYKAI